MNSVPISCHVTLKRNKCKHDLLGQKFNVSHVNDSFNGWMGCKSQVLKRNIEQKSNGFHVHYVLYWCPLLFRPTGCSAFSLTIWCQEVRSKLLQRMKLSDRELLFLFHSPDYSIIWAFSKEPRIEVFESTFTFTRILMFKFYIFTEYQDDKWV